MTDENSTLFRRAREIDLITLVGALDAAVRCVRRRSARLAGEDPSGQEDARVVRSRVCGLVENLDELSRRLRLHHLTSFCRDQSGAGSLHHFEVLLLSRQSEEKVRVLHQSLLSLYPAVTTGLVEAARETLHSWQEMSSADRWHFETEAPALLDAAEALTDRTRREIGLAVRH